MGTVNSAAPKAEMPNITYAPATTTAAMTNVWRSNGMVTGKEKGAGHADAFPNLRAG